MKRIKLIFGSLLCAGLAQAEPSPSVAYLMHEPLTLWDMGLYKMNKDLEAIKKDDEIIALGYVSYNWDRNRIMIGLSPYPDRKTIKNFEDWCRLAVEQTRARLGIDPKTGKPFQIFLSDTSSVGSNFSHTGYVNKNEPEDLAKHLDTIVEMGSVDMDMENKTTTRCTAPLLGKDVFISTTKF